MYGSAKPEALPQMPQGKQGQTYKELGYETSEKIHHLGKKASITDRLKPTLFSSNSKTGQYFSDKNIPIQLFHCSSATGSPIVAGSAPTKFFRETPVEMLSLKYKKRGGFITAEKTKKSNL